MPSILPSSKVLVTGASGFIAAWIVRSLLQHGYAVRGTVRSPDKGKYLKHLFSDHGERFEWAIVNDMSEDGAFDEAIRGVDAVVHTANPTRAETNDPQEWIGPAVKGITGILNRILKNDHSVKRVIFLSSSVTASATHGLDKIFDETDWNEEDIHDLETLGAAASTSIKYRASKILAEKAAWKIYQDDRDKVTWDLTVLNPPMVYGPVIHQVSDLSTLNSSSLQFYNALFVPGSVREEALPFEGSSYIDVRDLAEAHIRALEMQEAGGERIIIAAGWYVWQTFVDVAHAELPASLRPKLVKGVPGAGGKAKPPLQYNTDKAEQILSLRKQDGYRTARMTVKDVVDDFLQRGWIA